MFGTMSVIIQPSTGMGLSFLEYLYPGILIFALFSIGLIGTSVPLIEMRKNDILKTLRTTPLKIEVFILSQITVRFILAIFQILFFAILGVILGYIKFAHIIPFILISLLGMIMILTIGFFFGNFFKNEEVASGILPFVMMPLLFLSGALLPSQILPESVQNVAYVIPITYLTDLYHHILFDFKGRVPDIVAILIILAVSLVFFILSKKTFRWSNN
jgi:ABC-2 type transport system permease protein